jgi:hypothetical protein
MTMDQSKQNTQTFTSWPRVQHRQLSASHRSMDVVCIHFPSHQAATPSSAIARPTPHRPIARSSTCAAPITFACVEPPSPVPKADSYPLYPTAPTFTRSCWRLEAVAEHLAAVLVVHVLLQSGLFRSALKVLATDLADDGSSSRIL